MLHKRRIFILIILFLSQIPGFNFISLGFPISLDVYSLKRENIIKDDEFESCIYLNDKEKQVDHKLKELVEKYNGINTKKSLFCCEKNSITNTELYKLIKMIPKGANLHTHTTSTLSAEKLYELCEKSEQIYICIKSCGEHIEGELLFSESVKKVPQNFVPFKFSIENGIFNKEYLISLWTITEYDINQKLCLEKFQKIFLRVKNVLRNNYNFFGEFYKNSFLESIEDNIDHLEIRVGIKSILRPDDVTGEKSLNVLKSVYHNIKKEHPDFTLKIILSGSKSESVDVLKEDIAKLNYLKEKIKDDFYKDHVEEFIVGYDMVGMEDGKHKLLDYVPYLLDFKNTKKALLKMNRRDRITV